MNVARAPASLDLTDLFRAEAGSIFGYLLLRCGSRAVAEDLTGETFLAASRMFATGQANQVTPAWLQTVARRRLIDHWRSSSAGLRRTQRLLSERRPEAVPPHDPDGSVDRALSSLPERQRAALILRYLDDHSVSEIADVLDVSYKAAESLLARARMSFATAYQETHDD